MGTNNTRIAQLYAQGATKGQGSNLFIEGDTIYSYGYHFPIAKRITYLNETLYLFNSNGYSRTTVTHKNKVLNALPEERVIHIINCDITKAEEQIQENIKAASENAKKFNRAKKQNIKDNYLVQNKEFIAQNKILKVFSEMDELEIQTTI